MKRNAIAHPVTGACPFPWSSEHAEAVPLPSVESLRMECDAIIRLEKASRVKSIEVISGIAWLTGTPGDEDILLRAGERHDLHDTWPFVVQALEQAIVVLKA